MCIKYFHFSQKKIFNNMKRKKNCYHFIKGINCFFYNHKIVFYIKNTIFHIIFLFFTFFQLTLRVSVNIVIVLKSLFALIHSIYSVFKANSEFYSLSVCVNYVNGISVSFASLNLYFYYFTLFRVTFVLN